MQNYPLTSWGTKSPRWQHLSVWNTNTHPCIEGTCTHMQFTHALDTDAPSHHRPRFCTFRWWAVISGSQKHELTGHSPLSSNPSDTSLDPENIHGVFSCNGTWCSPTFNIGLECQNLFTILTTVACGTPTFFDFVSWEMFFLNGSVLLKVWHPDWAFGKCSFNTWSRHAHVLPINLLTLQSTRMVLLEYLMNV